MYASDVHWRPWRRRLNMSADGQALMEADWVESFYAVAMAKDSLQAITWWDFADPSSIKHGGLLREDHTPKQAYFRLRALGRKYAATVC